MASVVIPIIVSKIIIKIFNKHAEKVEPTEQLKEVQKELQAIKKEILEMRGKRK